MFVVGWIDSGTTSGRFTESVTQLAAYEAHMRRLASIVRVQSGPQMCEGRNLIVEQFLTVNADWLFMVDTDMTFPHDSVERLLATADPVLRPMVGGLCYGIDKHIGQFPTLYKNVDGLPVVVKDHPGGIVEVDATGAAFTLMHRSLFERYERSGPHRWFHRRTIEPTATHPGGILGEDVSWCWWLRECGVTILVDTTLEAGHMKPVEVNTATFEVDRVTTR